MRLYSDGTMTWNERIGLAMRPRFLRRRSLRAHGGVISADRLYGIVSGEVIPAVGGQIFDVVLGSHVLRFSSNMAHGVV